MRRPLLATAAVIMAKTCTEFAEGITMPAGFKKLTSNLDRCRYVLTHGGIAQQEVQISAPTKNEDEAVRLIKDGEKAFAAGDSAGATRCFNEALIYAPYASNSYISAISLRSARLYEDKKYLDCINDADLGLEVSNNERRLEFLHRKWACLMELKCKEAPAILKEALALSNSLGTTKAGQQLQAASASSNATGKLVNKLEDIKADSYWEYALPEVVGGAHRHMPSVSKHLKLAYHSVKGRHMIAAKDLKPGQVVMVEKPLMTIFMAAKRWDFCLNCVHRIQVPVPCKRCDEIAFCSADCRDEADSFHAMECGLLTNLDDTCHQRVRMAIQYGLPHLKNPKTPLVPADDLTHPTDPRHFDNLLGHDDKRTPQSNFTQALETIFCFKVLEKNGFFASDPTVLDDVEKKALICSKLMGFAQKCWVNSFMMAHYRPDNGVTEDIGTSVYSTISLMNHSCFPNCAWVFNGNVNIVRVLKSIRAGEEIKVSYNSFCTYMDVPAEKRRERYRRDYFFECDCQACTNEWGPETAYNEFPVKGKASFRRACLKTADLAQSTNEYNEELEKLLHLQAAQMDKLMPQVDEYKKPFIEYEKVLRAAHACNWMKRDWSTFNNPV